VKSHARVAVIGGGVVGCSVLYHLAKAGWTDVLLIERSELTSGSSWHAAGGFHTLNADPNVAKLQAYTVGLYRELEALSGQSCGLHLTGGVMLAGDPMRMDYLRLAHAKGRCLGMDTEIISASSTRATSSARSGTRSRGTSTRRGRPTPTPRRRSGSGRRSCSATGSSS
jgi:dimethylglycine dehydrogenase